MTLLADLQYFTSFSLLKELRLATHCVFEQYEHYRKGGFHSRCSLSGSNGLIKLGVPLSGGRDQKRILKEVRIDNRENWQSRHWKTIESCYNKSPFLDFYRDDLKGLYEKKFEFLADWNMACTEWICAKMAIRATLSLSGAYIEKYNNDEFCDFRNSILKSRVDEIIPPQQRYPQVFEDRFGFISNLSVLDRLFCVGNGWE